MKKKTYFKVYRNNIFIKKNNNTANCTIKEVRMIMLMMRAVNCLSKVATSKAIILILLFGKYHVIIQQQQQQQQILLKIGKITNYITFRPANSL